MLDNIKLSKNFEIIVHENLVFWKAKLKSSLSCRNNLSPRSQTGTTEKIKLYEKKKNFLACFCIVFILPTYPVSELN